MKILSLVYAGNIEWFCHLLGGDCVIDIYEHYHKQSYRNRCEIMTAGGVTPLSVQVVKPDNRYKAAVRDVRIDYSKRWQHRHWTSIASAYRNSPYFDHYAGVLEPFYRRRFDFLADLNIELLDALLDALGADVRPRFSERYIEVGGEQGATGAGGGYEVAGESGGGRIIDLRDTLSPKARLARRDPRFAPQEYYQVFSDRIPFAPNLSVIDLLLCEGPGAMEVLRGSCLLSSPQKK